MLPSMQRGESCVATVVTQHSTNSTAAYKVLFTDTHPAVNVLLLCMYWVERKVLAF
jgi:hypothetical protein